MPVGVAAFAHAQFNAASAAMAKKVFISLIPMDIFFLPFNASMTRFDVDVSIVTRDRTGVFQLLRAFLFKNVGRVSLALTPRQSIASAGCLPHREVPVHTSRGPLGSSVF